MRGCENNPHGYSSLLSPLSSLTPHPLTAKAVPIDFATLFFLLLVRHSINKFILCPYFVRRFPLYTGGERRPVLVTFPPMLSPLYNTSNLIEAGCDEAGRGCLAGSVYAAAVILPPDYQNDLLNDSKQLSAKKRYALREQIERDAVAWAVGIVTAEEIDQINILNASILAMHRALDALKVRPEYVIVDGNRFKKYQDLPHTTIVKGDGKYLSIAAASILAKTYRDDYMAEQHTLYPHYGWDKNAGYPTKQHREGIRLHGLTPIHRKTFNQLGEGQQTLFDDPNFGMK